MFISRRGTAAPSRWTGTQGNWCGSTGVAGSPAPRPPSGEAVIVVTRPGGVVALHRQTGARRWETHLKSPILASPIVAQGTVYIGAADKKLYALDAATGQPRWAFATQDWIVSAVAYAGDRVIVASQDSRLHVVGAETGRQRLVYETGMGRHIGVGPAIEGDRAYFGSVGARVWAIDWRATTYPWERALLFWQTNLYLWGMRSTSPIQKGSVWSRRVGGDVRHTPAIAHNTVYVTWRGYPPEYHARRHTLAIAHNTVYVTAAPGTVVALDAATGADRWRADLGMAITAAPTVAGTTVLVGTQDGIVVGLEAQTGAVLWDFKTAGKITASPIVAGDTMYVASHDGTLYAVARSQ